MIVRKYTKTFPNFLARGSSYPKSRIQLNNNCIYQHTKDTLIHDPRKNPKNTQ